MTLRERILSVYRGETPDVVPNMLDLSHWWLHRERLPWDLSRAETAPEFNLIAYHRAHGVGYYLPGLCPFYGTTLPSDVTAECRRDTEHGVPVLTWSYHTPLGSIARRRHWDDQTYSWRIGDWGVRTERDLRVLAYALGGRSFTGDWDLYATWRESIGDTGVVYLSLGYSAIGYLMNLWMGVEGTHYAAHDWPDLLQGVVHEINEANLRLIDLAAQSPAEIILMGDNFSTDIQPPAFFERWSRGYYVEAIRRLHAAGKYVALHLDGRLRGGLRMLAGTGADCADAVTPVPTGDLAPDECRTEAGPRFILSGGVAPLLWLPQQPVAAFVGAVKRWLRTRRDSPRLIAAAGDQVPPGADEGRITLFAELVEEHGRTDEVMA
jgi:hypothetical protein